MQRSGQHHPEAVPAPGFIALINYSSSDRICDQLTVAFQGENHLTNVSQTLLSFSFLLKLCGDSRGFLSEILRGLINTEPSLNSARNSLSPRATEPVNTHSAPGNVEPSRGKIQQTPRELCRSRNTKKPHNLQMIKIKIKKSTRIK